MGFDMTGGELSVITYDDARMFLGKEVVIHYLDGGVYRGVVTEVTPEHILVQSHDDLQRNYGYGGYGVGQAITALALYNILAISLFAW